MNKVKKKTLLLTLALLARLLLPLTMNAQYREDQFGLQEWGQTSLLGKEASSSSGGFNLFNQQFGEDEEGGYELYNQTFGQDSDTPLGSGLLILVAAGAGYAFKKRKNNNKKQES